MNLPPEVFLDTSYLVALAVRRDAHHQKALALSAAARLQRTRIITTHAVLLEVGNTFSKPPFRSAALSIQSSLTADPAVSVLPLPDELLQRAWSFFAERSDQTWGITDCLSFIVMSDLGIQAALTADVHFEQAGFRALLRETDAA